MYLKALIFALINPILLSKQPLYKVSSWNFHKEIEVLFWSRLSLSSFQFLHFFKKLYKEYITVRYIIQSNCIDTRLRSKGNIDRLLQDNNTSGKICAKWRDSIATTILVMTHFRWDDTILFCVPTHFAAK